MNPRFNSYMNWQPLLLAISALLMTLLPDIAYAYTLQCQNGFPSSGEVFIGASNCSGFNITNIFSGLNCQFQQILNEIIKRVYCGLQFSLAPTLQAVILIYVIVYAMMFSMGVAQLTAKELVTRLIKVALIWAFAMNASWGVGMAWYFFAGGIEYMVNLMLKFFYPNMDARGFFYELDNLIFNQLTGGLSTLGYGLLGFFATLIKLQPPIFLLFLVFMMTVMGALVRALVSYLLGLSAIAFLLALGPIFVSMALFRTTYTFFDSWLKYIVSFAIQIVLIFAAVALWLGVMSLFGNFFTDLAMHIVPYQKVHSTGIFAFFKNSWAVCFSGGVYDSANNVMTGACNDASEKPWAPSAYAAYMPFMSYLTANLISLGVVVYAFDALLRAIPELARQLSGPKFAPQLGGGHGFGAVSMPGFTALGNAKQRMWTQANQRLLGSYEGVAGKVTGDLAGGTNLDHNAANRIRQMQQALQTRRRR